jgi:hypothetical protein
MLLRLPKAAATPGAARAGKKIVGKKMQDRNQDRDNRVRHHNKSDTMSTHRQNRGG